MTGHPHHDQPPQPRPLIEAFPTPGRRVEQAYRELDIAMHGSTEETMLLGSPRVLPRPWDPPTCADPQLRAEIWAWLEKVVTWLNREYAWDAGGTIPACWPQHPHLVHEIAGLADQRRRAGHALTGEALEEWHRYALPAFTDRMLNRMRSHCQDKDHQPWPAQGRHTRHQSEPSKAQRAAVFEADIAACAPMPAPPPTTGPLLHLVGDDIRYDLDTGEIVDENPPDP